MGKQWDKAVPSKAVWQECLRVLKPGAFMFCMSLPRQDVLSRMIVNIEDAGFNVAFPSIYHTFPSGFPKASNLSKTVDKQAGMKSLSKAFNVAGRGDRKDLKNAKQDYRHSAAQGYVYSPATPEAKALEGFYAGYAPKPCVEVVIVAMKPIEHATYVAQALDNGHGCTNLDAGRIPYESGSDIKNSKNNFKPTNEYEGGNTNYRLGIEKIETHQNLKGRFAPHLLVEDDVFSCVQDKGTKPHPITSNIEQYDGWGDITKKDKDVVNYGDSGSFSRYFSLDSWAALHFPFFDDIPNVCNIGCTSYEPITSFFHRIQNKQDCSNLSLYLYKQFFYQVSPASFDNEFSHNNVCTCLSLDVLEFHHRLYTLLNQFSSDNSLHTSLLSNEVLCAQNLRELANFLEYYHKDSRLYDECDHLFSKLSPLIPLLLSYVLERILLSWREDYQDDIPEYISRQRLAYAFLLSSYHVSHYLSYIMGDYKKVCSIIEHIGELPSEVQKTFPFLIVPKENKANKNKGLGGFEKKHVECIQQLPDGFVSSYGNVRNIPAPQANYHPAVKSLKLILYLITIASRENDTILDPYVGSGTTLVAAEMLNRNAIGIELNKEYCNIAYARLLSDVRQLKIDRDSTIEKIGF